MSSERHTHHILGASTSLLGICFVLITGIKITKMTASTAVDEIALFAAFNFLISCLLSYFSIRSEDKAERLENIAHRTFLTGMICLFLGVMLFSLNIL